MFRTLTAYLLKLAGALLAAIIGLSMANIAGKEIGTYLHDWVFPPTKPSETQYREAYLSGLALAQKELDATMPIMLDEETRIDRVGLENQNRLVGYRTLVKYASSDIVDVASFINNIKSHMASNICHQDNLKRFFQYGGVFVLVYSANDGIEIARVAINRDDCGISAISP